jgi:hypothetical protein
MNKIMKIFLKFLYISRNMWIVTLLENRPHWNFSNPTPEFSDILWHPTKIDGPKVFLLTKIKPEYSDILYNLTHFVLKEWKQVMCFVCFGEWVLVFKSTFNKFQEYSCGQYYWWRKLNTKTKPLTCHKWMTYFQLVTDKFDKLKLIYTVESV